MTASTGKRAYRACSRCRSRKTKCDLDSFGQPKAPPCLSCHQSGSLCVLVESRRGGYYRPRQGIRRPKETRGDATLARESHQVNESGNRATSARPSEGDEGESTSHGSEDELETELRNPSDALHILTRSHIEGNSKLPTSSASEAQLSPARVVDAMQQPSPSSGSSPGQRQHARGLAGSSIRDLELIKGGLLPLDNVKELLSLFARQYHPFCPIVPAAILEKVEDEPLCKADHFLLTVILAIASRDQPEYSLTHRRCWEYTSRLLLDVLLARPWTQNVEVVRGLLLLAEWLPHIHTHETSSSEADTLFADSQTAWSIIGMAIRHAYLIRLDLAAFRKHTLRLSKHGPDQERLIWASIYIADRQISVRLGQSFWSRGPSLSSRFTAEDFPSLGQSPGNDVHHYARVFHATLDITQILHNVQGTLYSSQRRTLALALAGDYPRYLDDYENAATAWYERWNDALAQSRVKFSLLLMYEYLNLFVNAFSFQAVLTRLAHARRTNGEEHRSSRLPHGPFHSGLMASPDGLYVYNAIRAATKVLKIMTELDPSSQLRFLPSRFYLYGVHAAVFLYQALSLGAILAADQKQEVSDLFQNFAALLNATGSATSDSGPKYSEMLHELWERRARRSPRHDRAASRTSDAPASSRARPQLGRPDHEGQDERGSPTNDLATHTMGVTPAWPDSAQQREHQQQNSEEWQSWSTDAQLFGPFMPNLPLFGEGAFGGNSSGSPSFVLPSFMSTENYLAGTDTDIPVSLGF
ncbi:uncharacterized protein B0I36DRAFT_416203 [Microdochium trichocladiopsis]|uniref:Zn(2)-C6 fungal-type domain-containing protein n=1 Tax=Microdochium trichocladiopsis TaxID=1682393 RepID=A0A9P8XZ17_9PEZI|nr:uncharacterized protein B0I36DRAFT_416203 [Microdochium trichocladiopsis]KAH7024690.1 hypothetical protein B0I36DRAFT_416203 [Microdochium trichocladiopsis]